MLHSDGYVVIPAFDCDDLQTIRDEFVNTCKSFPEYKSHEQLVWEIFNKLGNASTAIRSSENYDYESLKIVR